MIIQLLKKDFVVARNYILIVLIVLVGFQIFFANFGPTNEFPVYTNAIGFLMSIILCTIIIFNVLSQYELRYPKVTAYFCTMPYLRSTFVKAKYISLIAIFLFGLISNTIVSLVANAEALLSVPAMLLTLMVTIIVFGIYIPFEFKYGYIKTRFFFVVIVLLIAFVPNIVANFLPSLDATFIESVIDTFSQVPTFAWCLIFAAVIVAGFCISMRQSIKIFENKEL